MGVNLSLFRKYFPSLPLFSSCSGNVSCLDYMVVVDVPYLSKKKTQARAMLQFERLSI